MLVFHADLDNTLIYSYKHDIGSEKRCVERYQGREISFMTSYAYHALPQVSQRYLFVPTTTRTMEQYQRIDFGIPRPAYALVCNGGILLKNDAIDAKWYQESLAMIQDAQEALVQAMAVLHQDAAVCFEVRNIQDLFVFTKSHDAQATIARLQRALHTPAVDILQNGCKVYVLPKMLQKGTAVRRFREKMRAETVFAAGDSLFDLSMLQAADVAFAPQSLQHQLPNPQNVMFAAEHAVFSDCILQYLCTNTQEPS